MSQLPRPHMPMSVKIEACLLRMGLDPKKVQWDHDPALVLRDFNEETGIYTPGANDPKFIVPREKEDHDDKTRGDMKQAAARRRAKRKLDEKIADQAERLAKGRQILKGAEAGELPEKDMHPNEQRKRSAFPKGRKLPTKNKGGQHTATRKSKKTARRFQ